VRQEGLDKLKKSSYLIGNRSRDLLACSILPEAITLPRAPNNINNNNDNDDNNNNINE
jgi:hypothetical protein